MAQTVQQPTSGGASIVLVGSPHLRHATGSVHPLERKDAALLALLALDGPTHRAHAARLLWPDLSEKQARSNLRQRLFRLRQAARRDLVDATSLLRLLDDVTLDLALIHRQLADDPAAAPGDLLAGLEFGDNEELEQWTRRARERWRSTRLNLLAQVASELESHQQIAAALPYAERMVAEDPLLEHAHRRLMRLHYLRGDRAAALAAFHKCRGVLLAELDAAPNRETLQLAALIEQGGALPQPAPAPRQAATLRPPRLVGRELPWHELERTLREAGAALVEGQPGIGKTRLMADFARAHGNAPVFGARPGDAQLPFALLARVLRGLAQRHGVPRAQWAQAELARIAPEFGVAPGGKLDPLRLQQAALQAFAEWAEGGLALLVVDDLHYADVATLEMLPALVSALGRSRVAWLLAVRSGEEPPAVAAWLAAADAGTPLRLALAPLDLSGVRALLTSLDIDGVDAGPWAAALERHTGGNPLFILETLIALLDHDAAALRQAPPALPAPAQVGELIQRRLAQLSAPALRLARLAAIAGQDFSVELATAVIGLHALDIADHWRELESAHVIRDDAFAHDLVLEATLRSVPQAIARALHRDVAAHLRSRGMAPAREAAHWEAGGEWGLSGAAYEEAADAAMAASRRDEEAGLWERAAACRERAGDRVGAFRARCARVKAVMALRPIHEAIELTGRLLADAQGDAERLDALLERSTVLLVGHDAPAALEAASEALALAQRLGLPWREFDAARSLAVALAQRKQGAEAPELLGRYRHMVEAQGSPRRRFDYWSDMAYVLNDAGRRRESAEAWRRAGEAAAALGDRHECVTCTANLATLLVQLGRTEEAYETAERARRLQGDLGHDNIVACMADMNVASFGLLLGHYAEAIALYESTLQRLRDSQAPTWAAACESNLASAWLQMGQTARAMQALAPLDSSVAPTTRARRHIVEGRIARALGRSAMASLQQALALLGDTGDPFQRALAELDQSREADPAEAVAQCERCRTRAEGLEMAGVVMKARLYGIDALLRRGDGAAAGALAREVQARLADTRPVDMHWAEVLWLLAQGLDAGGDGPAALAVLCEAARWIRLEALPRVPEPFRDAFLNRQPVNRDVLAAAARRQRA